ncbi:CHAP domain-containing protein [Herbidospora sp. RD11066]
MTPEMQKLITLLRKEIGYQEQSGGYTKFGDWYNAVETDSDYSDQPWCDMFLSWGADHLGYSDWFGKFSYTVAHAEWFQAQGAWGREPEPGAVVFFDWNGGGSVDGIDHVGLVTKVDGDEFTSIEGNTSNMVAERSHDTGTVVGFGYPEKILSRTEPAPAPAPPADEENSRSGTSSDGPSDTRSGGGSDDRPGIGSDHGQGPRPGIGSDGVPGPRPGPKPWERSDTGQGTRPGFGTGDGPYTRSGTGDGADIGPRLRSDTGSDNETGTGPFSRSGTGSDTGPRPWSDTRSGGGSEHRPGIGSDDGPWDGVRPWERSEQACTEGCPASRPLVATDAPAEVHKPPTPKVILLKEMAASSPLIGRSNPASEISTLPMAASQPTHHAGLLALSAQGLVAPLLVVLLAVAFIISHRRPAFSSTPKDYRGRHRR